MKACANKVELADCMAGSRNRFGQVAKTDEACLRNSCVHNSSQGSTTNAWKADPW